MIETTSNQTDNILAFTAHGQVTGEDYESVLIPAVEAKLKEHHKIRLLYHLDNDFSGFDAKALWDDTKVGFQHLTAWAKIAVVSNNNGFSEPQKFWIYLALPCKVFDNNHLAEANEWLKA